MCHVQQATAGGELHVGDEEEDSRPQWRPGTRTPRPYHRDGEEILQDNSTASPSNLSPLNPPSPEHPWQKSQQPTPPSSSKDFQQIDANDRYHDHDDYHDDHDEPPSVSFTPAASESGTEADDERPHSTFVKALPPATLRPRKGLKVGEDSDEVLLTPSQLDDEGNTYFKRRTSFAAALAISAQAGAGDEGAAAGDKGATGLLDDEEAEKVLRRRLAEFARRSSEVALMAAIAGIVLCGRGVWTVALAWRRELLTHLLAIVLLVLVYPVKLSIVDTRAARSRLLERFRVPASFDPATVLYPPFLPVLVALSVSPANGAVVLPNIILGLASLPQRLFPRSSRLGGFNSVHWLVAILPLIVARLACANHPSTSEYALRCNQPSGLSPETLVSLYPLHHALLQPLHYLTTTSLLVSELHLLSAALINLLLLASSPQAVILKSCLWIGGVTFFVLASPVLHWNVTLARVPRWKLRRRGHSSTQRTSLVDAVSELITLQRAGAAFSATSANADAVGSDADEDELQLQPTTSLPATSNTNIKNLMARSFSLQQTPCASARPRAGSIVAVAPSDASRKLETEPSSAVEPRHNGEPLSPTTNTTTTITSNSNSTTTRFARPRSNTLPMPGIAEPPKPSSPNNVRQSRSSRSSRLLWCLHLTPEQAERRKWIYAAYVYMTILVIVLGPVRHYVQTRALFGREPVGWAVSYLLGEIPMLRASVKAVGLDGWIVLPETSSDMGFFFRPWARDLSISWDSVASLLSSITSSWTATSRTESLLPLYLPTLRLALGEATIRLLLASYWLFILLLGLLTVFSLTAYVEVDTRRKVFHGVMVAMLLPSSFVDPCFCALALAVALAVFLLLEAIRAALVPPLGRAIARFVAPYVDGRDLRGPVVVSHVFLLIGCAVPLWFSLASFGRDVSSDSSSSSSSSSYFWGFRSLFSWGTPGPLLSSKSSSSSSSSLAPWPGWELADTEREVAMAAGVVCVGLGDAAASLIGRRYGRHKWIWIGGKSLEGSAAFAVAVTAGLLAAKVWMVSGGWNDVNHVPNETGIGSLDPAVAAGTNAIALGTRGLLAFVVFWVLCLLKAGLCAVGASFMEAVLTGANDNVVVPVALWLLVKGVRL